MSKVTSPRAAFVDHPVGRTFGPPHDRPRNEIVLAKALAEVPYFARAGEIHNLGCDWSPDGSRAWEDDLRAEMSHDR